jgi:hypothetical protein
LAASVALAAPDVNGCSGQDPTVETCDTGEPTNPNGFGTVNSQLGSTAHTVGEHSSDPVPGDDDRETPRKGVGNVSRTDGFLDPTGVNDTGTRPGDHACLIGAIDGDPNTDCTADPGLPTKP